MIARHWVGYGLFLSTFQAFLRLSRWSYQEALQPRNCTCQNLFWRVQNLGNLPPTRTAASRSWLADSCGVSQQADTTTLDGSETGNCNEVLKCCPLCNWLRLRSVSCKCADPIGRQPGNFDCCIRSEINRKNLKLFCLASFVMTRGRW